MPEKHYCECPDKACKVEVSITDPNNDEDLWNMYKKRFPEGLVVDKKTHQDNIPKGYMIAHDCPDTIMIEKV